MQTRGIRLVFKLLFVVVGLLLVAQGLNVAILRFGVSEMSVQTGAIIERIASRYVNDSLVKQIDSDSKLLVRGMDDVRDELQIMAGYWQRVIDERARDPDFEKAMNAVPAVSMEHRASLKSYSGRSEDVVLLAQPSLVNAEGAQLPNARKQFQQSRLVDRLLQAVQQGGRDKVSTYFVGPPDASVVRYSPYVDLAAALAQNASEEWRNRPYWDLHASVLMGWETWLEGEQMRMYPKQSVFTSPYDDEAGNGLMVTVMQPVWSVDRKRIEGAFHIDLSLNQIVAFVRVAKLGDRGFAFLTNSKGEIMAMEEKHERALGVEFVESGVRKTRGRFLSRSRFPDIAAIRAPSDDATLTQQLSAGDETFVTVSKRIGRFDTIHHYDDFAVGIEEDYWVLNYALPRSELFGGIAASASAISGIAAQMQGPQTAASLLVLIVMIIVVSLTTRRVIRSLGVLSHAAKTIMARDYTVRVDTSIGGELAQVAEAFNSMAAEIADHTAKLEATVEARTAELDATMQQLWTEMDLAKRIQTALLPKAQTFTNCDVAFSMRPADEVGGDYVDVFPSCGHVWMLVGDVSGHGVQAGLVMAMIQTAVRTTISSLDSEQTPLSPSDMLTWVNRAVYDKLRSIGRNQYMTVTAFRFDGDRVVYAGLHQDVYVYRAETTKIERLETDGIWLGLMNDTTGLLKDHELRLSDGDTVFAYTDGLTDAVKGKESFGDESLVRTYGNYASRNAQSIVDGFVSALSGYHADDDVTMLVFKARNAPHKQASDLR